MAICSVGECENDARTRGWCSKHYQRWRKHGDALIGESVKTCPNCGIVFKARANKQYCSMPCKYKVKQSIDTIQNRRANPNRYQNYTARNFARFGTRKCLYCEGNYVPYSDNSKHCSRSCVSKAKAKFGKPHYVQTCECCAKEFKSWNVTSRMCSKKCRGKAWGEANPYKRVAPTVKACTICEARFESSHNSQVACSKKCAEEQLKRNDAARKVRHSLELLDCYVASKLRLPVEIAKPIIPLKREQIRNIQESHHRKGETL